MTTQELWTRGRGRAAVLAAIALVICFAACGSQAYIALVVDAARDPDTGRALLGIEQLDTLRVTVSSTEGREVILEKEYPLDEVDHELPVTIVLEPGEGVARDLEVILIGMAGGVPVAERLWFFPWTEQRVTKVHVALIPVSP